MSLNEIIKKSEACYVNMYDMLVVVTMPKVAKDKLLAKVEQFWRYFKELQDFVENWERSAGSD